MLEIISALIGTYLVSSSTNKNKNIWGMCFWIISNITASIYFCFYNISIPFAILNMIFIVLSIQGILIRSKRRLT